VTTAMRWHHRFGLRSAARDLGCRAFSYDLGHLNVSGLTSPFRVAFGSRLWLAHLLSASQLRADETRHSAHRRPWGDSVAAACSESRLVGRARHGRRQLVHQDFCTGRRSSRMCSIQRVDDQPPTHQAAVTTQLRSSSQTPSQSPHFGRF